jgi:hypothetical protein
MKFKRRYDYTKPAYHFQVSEKFNEEFDNIYKLFSDLNERINYFEARFGILFPANNERYIITCEVDDE